jgi:hypothetical protein
MGKKRGMHIVKVERLYHKADYFTVTYKHSKCRHARTYQTYVKAIDELAAYMQLKAFHKGANQ